MELITLQQTSNFTFILYSCLQGQTVFSLQLSAVMSAPKILDSVFASISVKKHNERTLNFDLVILSYK